MMLALTIQNAFAPKKPLEDKPVQIADDQGDDQQADQDDESGNADVPGENKQDDASGDPGEAKSEDADSETALKPVVTVQDDFFKLGSLSTDGTDRYLVTINRKGGTIHQVELNARDDKGNFLYRDLVYVGGYLGSPNMIATDEGLKVNAVGNGTPAAASGLQPGDIIQNLSVPGGTPEAIVVVEHIEQWLADNTKPGDAIEIGIVRGGIAQSLTANLTTKPISIIRPEGTRVDANFDFPESFVFSLLQPQEYFNKAWPDVDSGMREGLWTVTDRSSDQMVELEFKVSQDSIQAMNLDGGITVYKRFYLPQIDDSNRSDIDSRSFHLDFEIEIKNESSQDLDLAYELDGPTGTSAETWWYANKIHGRQTAIGYTAGARDVVASTKANSYNFLGCPEIVTKAKKGNGGMFFCDPSNNNPDQRQLKFIGVDSHYFNVSLLPVVEGQEFLEVNSATAYPNNRLGKLPEIPSNVRLQRLVDCTFQMTVPSRVPANGSYNQKFEIFCGPKAPEALQHYGLDDTRTFGWFSWCSYALLWLLHSFYWITFKTSYGLAIIMLTVLVRCFMIPFSRRAALNAQMMQHLAPQIKEITDKYPDDLEKRAAAQRELYKKYNFNPLGGCFMMFFQLPIFYGLYKGLNVDIALRDQPLIPGLQWCSNLAAPDQLLYWKDWMPGWLADETGYLGPYLNILPLITMALFFIQQQLFSPPATDDQQKFMQRIMSVMMLFLGIMFFKVPAGLCIYFITSSLWGIIERKLLPKPVLDVDKLEGTGTGNKITAEATQEMDAVNEAHQAELEARKKRNAERKKRLQKKR